MHIAFWILAYVWKSADWIFFFSLSGHMYKNLLAMSLFFCSLGHMHGNLSAMSLFFCSLGHMHGNLSAMSLFFCLPGHICQKKRYMSHCRRHKGHNAKEWFYMSHCAKKRDITEQKFSICPQTKKSPFFISRNTKSRKLSPTFVLQQTFVHYKTLQKGASCPTPFL